MRIAVVSPETIRHRDADDTRRLQRLLRGLSNRGHEVTVCCARWWDADVVEDGQPGANDAAATANGDASAASTTADGATAAVNGDGSATPSDATAPNAEKIGPGRNPDDLPPAGNPDAGAASEGDAGLDDGGVGLPTDESTTDGAARGETGHDGDEVPATIAVDGITYRSVVDDPGDAREFATRIPFAVRRASPDVIHALATPPAAVLGARAGATLARAPLLTEWYDPSRDDAEDWTTQQALARSPRIVTPSRLTRRQLLEHGAEDARLRVLPNAIDVEQIRSVEPVDGPDVVYARRLDADANVESLLLGLAELRERGWSATIVGDGPERSAYEQQVRDLRIDDRVTFAGACDLEERLGIYRGAHAFVQTARHCVFATELLWALACGCVGIVEYHAESSAHELVEGRDRGFRTTNPQETAQAIRDAGDLERLTVDESFDSFDQSSVLDQYVTLYEELREDWGLF